MMIQESCRETNYINQIILTNTVTCSIKFKSSNYKSSLCWHWITNTSMVTYNNPIYMYSHSLTQYM